MRLLRRIFLIGCLGFVLATPVGCDNTTSPEPNGDSGRYVACDGDAKCDTEHGFVCADGLCRYACDSHFDCGEVGLCQAFERGTFCSPLPEPQPDGHYYTSCPNGDECDAASNFFCVSAGAGDLDGYCTNVCAADEDCPTGFFCESVGVTPCDDVCDVRGSPSNPECVPESEIGEGKAYRCSGVGPVRDQCVKRRFCAACETDDDCLAEPGLICAKDLSGAKICTTPCDQATGSCPWGNAAVCRVTDEERGIATCSHRYGSCKGEGAPCEPCVRDQDCRETGFCYGSSYTGERYCLDLAAAGRCSCADETISGGLCQGGGCPRTPGELEMLCLPTNDDTLEGVCYGANASDNPLLGSPQTGCWGPI